MSTARSAAATHVHGVQSTCRRHERMRHVPSHLLLLREPCHLLHLRVPQLGLIEGLFALVANPGHLLLALLPLILELVRMPGGRQGEGACTHYT